MAYTSIIPVHRLDRSIEYVKDREKTSKSGISAKSLEEAIAYALNRDKTEQMVFEDALGCTCENAYTDMLGTKRRFHKTGGVQGYHLIQSFSEGEVTPELAHLLGIELAERLLKGRYEVVITTHLNTSHYHNHLVWNSVRMGKNTTVTRKVIMKKCGGFPMICVKSMGFPLYSRKVKENLMRNGWQKGMGNRPGGAQSVWISKMQYHKASAGANSFPAWKKKAILSS